MARDKRYGTEREVKAFSMFAKANVLVLAQQPNGSFLASPDPHITLPDLGAMTEHVWNGQSRQAICVLLFSLYFSLISH